MHALQDNAIEPDTQRILVERVQKVGIPVKEFSVNASHSPFLSQIQDILQWINKLAGIID